MKKSVEAIIQMSITESYFGCNKHRYNIPFTHLSDIELECKTSLYKSDTTLHLNVALILQIYEEEI